MSTEEPTSAPEQPEPKWGDPISEERQAELLAILNAWNAPDADHGDKKGPFDKEPGQRFGVPLTGADVFWLAERSGRDEHGQAPNLHLEGAHLASAHLEGANLGGAHLETLYVNIPLCQYPVTGPARGGDEIPCGHTDPHERRKQHKQARDARSRGD